MKLMSFFLVLTFSMGVFANCQQDLEKQFYKVDDKFWAYHHCSKYSRAMTGAMDSEIPIIGAMAFIVSLATIFPKYISLKDEVRNSCEYLDKFTQNYSYELSKMNCSDLPSRISQEEVYGVTDSIASCTQDGWHGPASDLFRKITTEKMRAVLKAAKARCRN